MQPNPPGHHFLGPRLWDTSVKLHPVPIHFDACCQYAVPKCWYPSLEKQDPGKTPTNAYSHWHMTVHGLHRRFEGQQGKQVVIDSKLWVVKNHLNWIYSAVVERPLGECRCAPSCVLTEFVWRRKQTCWLRWLCLHVYPSEAWLCDSNASSKVIHTLWGPAL